MDELDKKLYRDLSSSKTLLQEEFSNNFKKYFDTKIKNNLYTRFFQKTMYSSSVTKTISVACMLLLIITGIVYASEIVLQYVWQQPEKTVGFSTQSNTISTEEQISAISEVEARKKAIEIFKKFGYKNQGIISMQLDNNSYDYNLNWFVQFGNSNNRLSFDARNGNNLWLSVDSSLDGNIYNYRTTRKDAEKTARNLCKKYGYDLSNYNHVQINSNMELENKSYIWYVTFYKVYDGFVNPYEYISLAFIPEINQLYKFRVSDIPYENNFVEVSEYQAKQKVEEIEHNLNTIYNIKNITAKLDLVKMNGNAHSRITDYGQYRKQQYSDYPDKNYVDYRTVDTIRKAWVVTIQYNIPNDTNYFDNNYNPFDEYYTYYIDVTTGEIIGGSSVYHKQYTNK